MNQTPKVGIEVGAEVDRSVGRTFERTEKQVRGLGREQQRMERTVGKTNRTVEKQRRVLGGASKSVKQYKKDVDSAGKSNSVFSRSMTSVGNGLDGVLNKWTALAGGVAGLGSAAMTLTLDETIVRLGIQANKSAGDMAALKDEVFEISQLSGIRVDPTQMVAAIEKIVEKTGDLDLAQRNMKNIGLAIQATGARGIDIGGMIADMAEKFDIDTENGMKQMLDTLVLQGKAGAFTLQNLATEGETVTASYARMGRTGASAIREMGALLQMAKKGSGSPAEAATAYESVLEDLVSNRKKLDGLGIELWDPEQLAKGKEIARSVPQILKEIMIATGGNVSEYTEIFGEEAQKGVSMIAAEFQKTGGFEMFDSFLKIQGNGSQLMSDSATAANAAAASYRNLMYVWRDIADGAFSGPMQSMADALNRMDKDTLKLLIQIAAGGAVALGAMAVGKKAWDVGKGVTDFVRGGKGGAKSGSSQGGLGGMGVTPVFVTNMGGGLGGGKNSKGKASRGVGGATKGRGLMQMLGRGAVPVTAALGALSIGSTLMDDDLSGGEKVKQVSGDVGGIGGALAGAAAGAAVGSVVPVIGTAVGGIVGGILGGLGGEFLGSTVGGWFADDDEDEYAAAVKSEAVKQPQNKTINSQLTATFNINSTQPEAAAREAHARLQQMRDAEVRQQQLAYSD